MSIKNIEKLEHNMAKITIEVATTDFEKYVEAAYQKNKNKISVPGFRKGKVPRQMMEKMYGKAVFFEDAANICIPEEYSKAYDECEEEIVSAPEIDVVQIEPGKEFIFTAEVALKPEVKLGAYKGVEIDKVSVEVTDEELDAEIKKALEENSRQVTVEREIKDGDLAVIDFEGFMDDVAFEGGKGENYNLTIGSGSFIPGFEEQLIGKKAGEECDVNVTFPEEYHAKDLAGKPAVFKCKIHEVKEKQVPEFDDAFADDLGFDTVDEYKEDLKKNLQEKKEKAAKDAKEDAVITAIVEGAEMDIPEAMIKTTQRQMMQEFAQNLRMQGLSFEQYCMFTGLTEENMMEQTRPGAERRIKTRLVLEAVAKAEGFEATEEEYDAEIKELAESYKADFEQVKANISDKDREQFKLDVIIRKAIDLVMTEAKEK